LRAAITDGAPLRRTLDDLAEDLILATQMLDRKQWTVCVNHRDTGRQPRRGCRQRALEAM
jgi:hypothetical protein